MGQRLEPGSQILSLKCLELGEAGSSTYLNGQQSLNSQLSPSLFM